VAATNHDFTGCGPGNQHERFPDSRRGMDIAPGVRPRPAISQTRSRAVRDPGTPRRAGRRPSDESRRRRGRVELLSQLHNDCEVVGYECRVRKTDAAEALRWTDSALLPNKIGADTRPSSRVLSLHVREAPREVRSGTRRRSCGTCKGDGSSAARPPTGTPRIATAAGRLWRPPDGSRVSVPTDGT